MQDKVRTTALVDHLKHRSVSQMSITDVADVRKAAKKLVTLNVVEDDVHKWTEKTAICKNVIKLLKQSRDEGEESTRNPNQKLSVDISRGSALAEQIENQNWPHIKIVDGLREGKGVFTIKVVPKGTIICNYGGDLLDQKTGDVIAYDKKRADYIFMFRNGRTNKMHYFDNYNHAKNIGRYINHSAVHPNVQPKVFYWEDSTPEIVFTASCDIEVNTQILFNYGDQYQNPKKCVASCAICSQEKTGHNITQTEDTNSEGNTSQNPEDPNQSAESKGSDQTGDANTSAEAQTSNVAEEDSVDSDSESIDEVYVE